MDRLGPYLIEREIGRGGMGTVFAARHEESGERAAVKMLAESRTDEAHHRARFQSEIETLRQLDHPNIVKIFGFGEQDGRLFFAMELVEGRTLSDELKRGRRFTPDEVLRFGLDVCHALRHAHDRGIIHRDVKPANLILSTDGSIKITDFGIARLFGAAPMTAAGGVLGTVDYMAPEQARGRPATARSDLYSLGSVLFALLARRPPFAAAGTPEVIHGLLHYPTPPLANFAPAAPPALIVLIESLLAKEPEERPATALAVANKLVQIGESQVLPTAGDEHEFEVVDPADAERTDMGDAEGADLVTRDQSPDSDSDVHGRRTQEPLTSGRGGQTVSEPEAVPPPRRTRFTEVDESPGGRRESGEFTPQGWSWLKIWLGAALALLIVLGIGYALLPASADTLFERIESAAGEGPGRLAMVEDDMQQFVDDHPDDPRREEVLALQRRLSLYRLRQKYERRQWAERDRAKLQPVEELYLEARALEETRPEAAVAKLEALLALYDGAAAKTEEDSKAGDIAALAREDVRRLRKQLDLAVRRHTEAIKGQLRRADRLRQDDPRAAREIWRSLIELYRDKPWAAEQVEQARGRLQETDALQTEP